MFGLLFLGNVSIFSTKEKAERECARFINSKMIDTYSYKSHTLKQEYRNAFCQERYADCLSIWNKFINDDNNYMGNSLYTVSLYPVEIDKPYY